MKITIKSLAVIAFIFSFATAINAQRGGGRSVDPEQMAESQTSEMVEKLSLDESQTAKIQEINLTYAQKMQSAQEENKGRREAMKVIRTAIDNEKNAEIKLVLTEDQYKTYEEMTSKKGKGRKGGRKGGREGGREG